MAAAFVYVESDRNKTPIDPKDQPAGTALVFVNTDGRDYHFLAGKTIVTDPAKQQDRFNKGNSGHSHEG